MNGFVLDDGDGSSRDTADMVVKFIVENCIINLDQHD